MKLSDAAKEAGVSEITLRDHIAKGNVKASQDKMSRRWDVDEASLRDWMANYTLSPLARSGKNGNGKRTKPAKKAAASASAPASTPAVPSRTGSLAGSGGAGGSSGAVAGGKTRGLVRAAAAADAVLVAFPDEDGATLARKILAKALGGSE